jgi:glycosyltransferase involved in cell wall biosynthesis
VAGSSARERPVLSVIVPVFNEAATLRESIARLAAAELPCPWELIVVDDGSTDGSTDELDHTWAPSSCEVTRIRLDANAGKGAAIRVGFDAARGQLVGVHDADLEYDPKDLPALLAPLLRGEAEVVFGVRDFTQAAFSPLYTLGNKTVSLASSLVLGRRVRDAYTCYKFFRRDLLESLHLAADGFAIEAELTVGLLADRGVRFAEAPISYDARSRAEGKKIHAVDGVKALVTLARVRIAYMRRHAETVRRKPPGGPVGRVR